MLNKLLRITNDTEDCKVEFKYLWVWKSPYTCVDATYLYLGKDKEYALNSIKEYVYKLWYINTDCSAEHLIDEVLLVLNSNLKNGVHILESDVYNLVYSIYNKELPKDISQKVIHKGDRLTTRKVEWKKNLNSLLVIDEDLSRFEGEYREIKIKELYKLKKLRYAMKCISEVTQDCNEAIVNTAIDLLKPGRVSIPASEISKASGLSLNTVKKYIDLMHGRLDCIEGYKVTLNSKVELKDKKMIQLKEAKDLLITKGLKVNVLSLSKITNISRITVNKYWDELKKL